MQTFPLAGDDDAATHGAFLAIDTRSRGGYSSGSTEGHPACCGFADRKRLDRDGRSTSLSTTTPVRPSRRSGRAMVRQAERRNLVSSGFITMLLALAYEQMAAAFRDSLASHGLTLVSAVFFVVFLLTSMRFFIGNILHLTSSSLLRLPGLVWLFDFLFITAQTTVLVFIGGTTSDISHMVPGVGFVELLILLYLIDMAWILSQWTLHKVRSVWRRSGFPWPWAVLNTSLVTLLVLGRVISGDFYSEGMLISLCILSVVGFIVDMVLVDQYGVLARAPSS